MADAALRQAANINLQRIGLAADAAQQFASQDGRHAGRQTAVRRDRHACGLRLHLVLKLLLDDGVVAAEIGEVTPVGSPPSPIPSCKSTARGEHAIVAAHDFSMAGAIGGIELHAARPCRPRLADSRATLPLQALQR